MIYELRTYTLQPGGIGPYLKLAGEVGRKVRGDDYGVQEGAWSTEFGTLNQYVHLWRYPDLNERERLRKALGQNERWAKEYVPQIRPFMLAQENKILSAVLAPKAPAEPGHVYELRTYRAHVGKLAEWLKLFTEIMPVREKFSKNVAVFQTEVSQLNEAVHLWAYRDLNHRAQVRAGALQDADWTAFVAKATPLLAEMRSVVLVPTPVSKLR
ncbi:MAG TPA: NIPSNAP family protein [Candidatus Binatia bacterium]|nr:NIPSNAP family protein [Candidatus Binatia bacterium]